MAYVLALCAGALSCACAAFSSDRGGVAPEGATMRLSHLGPMPWPQGLAGRFALLLTTFVLPGHGAALRRPGGGPAVMTTELLFLIIILATPFPAASSGGASGSARRRCFAGRGGLLAMAAPRPVGGSSGRDWWVVGGITVVAAAASWSAASGAEMVAGPALGPAAARSSASNARS